MSALDCRLLPSHPAAGPDQMAADDALLAAAAGGVASLRFYTWLHPTLTLGYFQSHAPAVAAVPSLPWLRRPSGGAALVHHHELTYALALPADAARAPDWIPRVHAVIQSSLRELSIPTTLCATEEKRGDVLCFLHHTPSDLLLAGHKVAGSAQRKLRGALLQHGGILLARSPHTPELPGIADLAAPLSAADLQAALLRVLARDLGFHLQPVEWTEADRAAVSASRLARYTNPAWNEKR